jgi:uncharacterized protein with FMN-binding domain
VRTRAKIVSVVSSVAVLALGWELGSAATVPPPATDEATAGTDAAGSAGSTGEGSTGSSDPTSAPETTAADGTYTGDVVSTRYGDAQVAVTISAGQITEVTALQLPDREGRSQQISWSAEPILREEVLTAQSADVSIVSRATYTSGAYIQSLQSALQNAGW